MDYIVVVGNAFDGMRAYGPFSDESDALAFAEDQKQDWHIVTCDICEGPQYVEGDDWNGETGNHRSCEEVLS